MTSILSLAAKEKSAYVITASFKDEDDNDVVPTSITWTLTNSSGTIMNSREDVPVSIPAISVNIVLSGNDLALVDEDNERVLTIQAVYTSAYGSGLSLNDEIRFRIEDLLNIS